ncbi:uncharacterized protein J3R85_000059 [Psidium guajava]|nr:uncharacterized protein J3R85_000059 [Psidium guajava]
MQPASELIGDHLEEPAMKDWKRDKEMNWSVGGLDNNTSGDAVGQSVMASRRNGRPKKHRKGLGMAALQEVELDSPAGESPGACLPGRDAAGMGLRTETKPHGFARKVVDALVEQQNSSPDLLG